MAFVLSWKRQQRPQPLPSKPVEYPSGLFVQTEKGYFYIAAPGKRYRFTTKRALESYAPQRVVKTTEAALKNYRVVKKMKFRNGSLIHNIADGKVYYISEGKRRHLTSPEAFDKVGAERNRRYVVSVSIEEINLHPEGEPIT